MAKQSISVPISAIQVQKPADLIMRQIRNLIASGALKAGDRLPPERVLALQFAVGRGHVREALRKMECYGVLQTFPQSGTVVASLGAHALARLISNLLDLDRDDIAALNETRVVLELQVAKLAAERATKTSIDDLRTVLGAFRAEVDAGRTGVEEDLMFHLAVARAARNPIMLSLIALITPDIIRINKQTHACEAGRAAVALREHERIFAAIEAGDVNASARAMADHMHMTQAQYRRDVAPARLATRGRKRA